MYLSYASAHAHDSSNHSYVSMNMDSVNDRDRASAPRYPISDIRYLHKGAGLDQYILNILDYIPLICITV